MEKASHFEKQRKALADVTDIFLRQNFGFSPKSIKVLMDHDLVVIRTDNFLSRAEIKLGQEKRDKKLIHEMYSRLFDRVKAALVEGIEQITRRRVISSHININFETELCMMDFFLASKPNKENMRLALLMMPPEKE